jgi:pyroglutamyl-peptidase
MSSILITTFQTWLPHQLSNSSDDLVWHLAQTDQLPIGCHLLRQIPVDFHAAPATVIAKIAELQPAFVVCCGMAEQRLSLSVESNGRFQSDLRFVAIDLPDILQHTVNTTISHDAGGFVCNYLYYQVLRHLQSACPQTSAIFVHIPPLNDDNRGTIVHDFLAVLASLTSLKPIKSTVSQSTI